VVQQEASTVRFAVIGDFGRAGPPAAAVAELVRSWSPDLVLTVGDNNYPDGAMDTIDDNVGQYYHQFIAPYRGKYGAGADVNRFFPSLGNHDWKTWNLAPYLEYFTLPGNERYYDARWGPVHFFALDSNRNEPDGIDADSDQARWLQERLESSDAPYQVVFMHHPPYSSGHHGSEEIMRWPFHEWGADLVLSGHDHHYERIERPEGTYVINGLGGHEIYEVGAPIDGSEIRFAERHGAMRVEAGPDGFEFEFVDIEGTVIDRVHWPAAGSAPAPTEPAEATGTEVPPVDFERYED
jgi:hypothetical protein